MTQGLKSIIRNAGHLVGARIVTQGVRGFYIVLLARFLGPEIYGYFAYGQSWYLTFLPLAAIGLGSIIGREVGRDKAAGSEVAVTVLVLRILLTLVAVVLCGGVGLLTEASPFLDKLLLVFSFAIAGRSVALWGEQVFVAFEASRYVFRQEALFRTLEATLGLVVLGMGGQALAIAGIHVIIWWVQALCGLYLVRNRLMTIRIRWIWKDLVKLLVLGVPLCLSALFSGWFLQGPLILYRYFGGGETDLGQLALAMQVLVLMSVVPWSICRVSLPMLSRTVVRQDGKDLWFAEGMLRVGFLLWSAVAFAAMTFGPSLIEGVFGDRYALAGQMLGPALWLLIPLTAGTSLAQVLVARGRYNILCLHALSGALVFTLVLPLCASNWGIGGVLLATGTGMVVWALGLALQLKRICGLNMNFAVMRPGIAVMLSVIFYKLIEPVGVFFALISAWVILLGASLIFGLMAPFQGTKKQT